MPLYTLGVIYLEKGEYNSSISSFRNFVKVLPYFPETHHLFRNCLCRPKSSLIRLLQVNLNGRFKSIPTTFYPT